ncbi:MAG: ORF6N domain-containing protein [Bacteroidota bacterium]
MSKHELIARLPDETVMNKIYFIRGHKVMIDSDLAELYKVETRILNQAVSRNEYRFPEDFMFQTRPDFPSPLVGVYATN